MVARAKKDFPAIASHSAADVQIDDATRAEIVGELGRAIPPEQHSQFIECLQGAMLFCSPWRKPLPPSVAVRKAGLKRVAELADELARAISIRPRNHALPWKAVDSNADESCFGADWQAVHDFHLRQHGDGLLELQHELDQLVTACVVARHRCKKGETRHAEPFDELAGYIIQVFYKATGEIPKVGNKAGNPYLPVLRICAERLRGKRTTEQQVRPSAKLAQKALREGIKNGTFPPNFPP